MERGDQESELADDQLARHGSVPDTPWRNLKAYRYNG
jgi:hypothetical protein